MAHYRWQLATKADDQLVESIAQSTELPTILAQILVERGCKSVADAEKFLHHQMSDILPPDHLHDMKKTVARLEEALANDEQITVYGDYDADGITSTSLMYEMLLTVGAKVNYYVPNRFRDGYGPNVDAYQRLIDAGTQLIVTVDNGVSGKDAIALAKKQGVDVIITDHHDLPEELPNAYAIVHPHYPGAEYDGGDLSGVGVAFKVAWQLLEEFPTELLDLVAIGEIADVVNVSGENRALISAGIQQLRTGTRAGIHELVKLAGVNESQLSDEDIAFQLAPRLNALGRIADANDGVQLLTTPEPEKADALAKHVDEINQQRRQLVKGVTKAALAQAHSSQNLRRQTLLLRGKDWHQGVLGIAAARVVEETGKPTIVASINSGETLVKASGRAPAGFNLFSALNKHRDLMVSFGGHPAACGLSFAPDQADDLAAVLEQAATDQKLDENDKQPLLIAGRLTPQAINLTLAEQLKRLAPFGPGNSQPVFELAPAQVVLARTMGKGNEHLRLTVADSEQRVNVVAFNQAKLLPAIQQAGADHVKLAVTLGINEWKGQRRCELMLKDILITPSPIVDERTRQLTPQMFTMESDYLIYGERLRKNVAGHINGRLLTPEQARQTDFADRKLTIVDCPPSLRELAADLKSSAMPSSLRLLLWSGHPAAVEGLPSRQSFAQLFYLLQKQEKLLWPAAQTDLAKTLRLSGHLVKFMVSVFLDAGFVTIEDGFLRLVTKPARTDLTQQPHYRQRVAQIDAENLLLGSSTMTLLHWVEKHLTND